MIFVLDIIHPLLMNYWQKSKLQIQTIQISLKAILTKKKNHFFAKQWMYEFANEQNKHLVNLLRQHSQVQIISTIKDNAENLCHDNESINRFFRAFY